MTTMFAVDQLLTMAFFHATWKGLPTQDFLKDTRTTLLTPRILICVILISPGIFPPMWIFTLQEVRDGSPPWKILP